MIDFIILFLGEISGVITFYTGIFVIKVLVKPKKSIDNLKRNYKEANKTSKRILPYIIGIVIWLIIFIILILQINDKLF